MTENLESPSGNPHSRRPSTWTRGLVVAGVAMAIANMLAAWIVLYGQPEVWRTPPTQQQKIAEIRQLQEAMSSSTVPRSDSDSNSNQFLEGYMRLIALSAASNDGELSSLDAGTIAAIALGFALIAIGFSLFVMGLEGAMSLRVETADFGSLVMRSSSPGLACMAIAALLICVALIVQRMAVADPTLEARAETVRSEGYAKESEILAQAELVRAQADAVRTRAEAEAELIRAKAE
jgi:hypothetical protein